MKLENQNIVIVSNEPWGDIWYSKHNYAHELSKKNKVYFIDPPKPFTFSNFFRFKIEEKIISDSLSVIKYPNVLPVSFPGFWKINDTVVLKRLRRFFGRKKVENITFWSFDPIRLYKPEILKPKKKILHIVDAYLFSYKSEECLAKKADLVVCVSEKIAENYKKYNANVITVPHAVPDDEFITESHKRNKPLKGLFIGKIDLRIDFDYNIQIFKSFPDIEFTLIGMADDVFREKVAKENLSNVNFVGPIKSSALKKHISAADFCFVFKNIYSGNNIFSHKLMQYLAQGKPIFGTDFSDIPPELRSALYMSNNVNEMKTLLREFCNNEEDPRKAETRIEYARKHTFSNALSLIEKQKDLPYKNPYLYYDKVSQKTKLFNLFRKCLTNPIADKPLSQLMRNQGFLHAFFSKLIAPEYLYKKPSYRKYSNKGIKMDLDISNLVDHCVYFSFPEKGIHNFIAKLKPDDNVIDVGTNIGYITLLFSKTCHNGKILSVEPSKKLFKVLTHHLELNNVSNVEAFNIGLAEKEKTAKLYQVSENNTGMNRVLEDAEGLTASESIILKTLDQLARETKTEKINAIKIDVEGYEYNILKGAAETLKNHKPLLLIEVDDFNLKQQNASVKEMFDLLENAGYLLVNAETLQNIDLSGNYTNAHFDIICFPKK